MWRWKPKIRSNISTDTVESDDFGLIGTRLGNADAFLIKQDTASYPNVIKLLLRWLNDTLQEQLPQHLAKKLLPFPVTSITVNRRFPLSRHRDKNNVGPSFLLTNEGFSGGGLYYWPEDGKENRKDKDLLLFEDAKLLVAPAIFDGTCTHEPENYVEEEGKVRYSFVFYPAAGPED